MDTSDSTRARQYINAYRDIFKMNVRSLVNLFKKKLTRVKKLECIITFACSEEICEPIIVLARYEKCL